MAFTFLEEAATSSIKNSPMPLASTINFCGKSALREEISLRIFDGVCVRPDMGLAEFGSGLAASTFAELLAVFIEFVTVGIDLSVDFCEFNTFGSFLKPFTFLVGSFCE